MPKISLTHNSDSFTGSDGTTADTWETIAEWQAPALRGWIIHAGDLIKFDIEDTTPAQITSGLLQVCVENPRGNVIIIDELDLSEIDTWANQKNRNNQLSWSDEAVILPHYKLVVRYKSTTASVNANCQYALKVEELVGLTDARAEALFPDWIF